jgi:hypothetical protein
MGLPAGSKSVFGKSDLHQIDCINRVNHQ